jgi:hypothetical protein
MPTKTSRRSSPITAAVADPELTPWQAALTRAGVAPLQDIAADEFSVADYLAFRNLESEGTAQREIREALEAGTLVEVGKRRLRTGRVGTAYKVART